jgi:hypothetical protein
MFNIGDIVKYCSVYAVFPSDHEMEVMSPQIYCDIHGNNKAELAYVCKWDLGWAVSSGRNLDWFLHSLSKDDLEVLKPFTDNWLQKGLRLSYFAANELELVRACVGGANELLFDEERGGLSFL